MHVNYPGFLTFIIEAAFCVFFNSDVVRGINVTVTRGQALMLRQSGDKHNQPGLKLTLCKNKGIVSSWDLKVIFCLSLLMKSFALLELFTEKLCFFSFSCILCASPMVYDTLGHNGFMWVKLFFAHSFSLFLDSLSTCLFQQCSSL